MGRYYFELPAGVSSLSSITIFDDHSLGTCITGSASFDIFTGPEILGIEAWNGASAEYPTSVPIYHPGIREFSSTPSIQTITDNQYGDENMVGACTPYNNLEGTDAGTLPNLTTGLAGTPDMSLGAPDPFSVYGTLGGSSDCGGGSETIPAPVYPAGIPGKREWPGYTTIGCGGRITYNFSTPIVPRAGSGIAGADLVIFEVGFAEDPVAASGSSTTTGPVTTIPSGASATITITNDSAATYTSGGLPPFGFEFEQYAILVVDGDGVIADQQQEFTADPISPDAGLNSRTLGPYTVGPNSVFYFYAFGDDDAAGNGDTDGVPEQIFASDIDVTGISFLGYTGITPEPTTYNGPTGGTPLLLGVGRAPSVWDGGGAASWTLYAFGSATPVGSLSFDLMMTADVNPNTLKAGSKGQWITVYIEPGDGFDPADIDLSTLVLSDSENTGAVYVATDSPNEIGDGNNNGEPDLMVKFDRQAVASVLTPGDEIEVHITGLTFGGVAFEALDVIKVIE